MKSLLLTLLLLSGCGKAPVDSANTDTVRVDGVDHTCHPVDDKHIECSFAPDKAGVFSMPSLSCKPDEHAEELPMLDENMPHDKLYVCEPDKAAALESSKRESKAMSCAWNEHPVALIDYQESGGTLWGCMAKSIIVTDTNKAVHINDPLSHATYIDAAGVHVYDDGGKFVVLISGGNGQCIISSKMVRDCRFEGKPDKATAPEYAGTENPRQYVKDHHCKLLAKYKGMWTYGCGDIHVAVDYPIPACHHCPVAPPKIEKHRRHKKPKADWFYNCARGIGKDCPEGDYDFVRASPCDPAHPNADEVCHELPSYPPDYKMPVGEP